MSRILRAIVRNWQLKLLAVALSVLLWVVVTAEQVTTTWLELPIEVEEADPDFALIDESVPRTVRVRLAGPGRAFLDLAVRNSPLLLRIGEVDDVEQNFDLGPSMVRLPGGANVNVNDIDPPFLRLRFQRLAVRDLPIRLIPSQGGVGEMALVGPLVVSQDRVRVSGPAERVVGMPGSVPAPFDLPVTEGPFEAEVPLDLAAFADMEASATSVRVSGRLERVVQNRFQAVPISIGSGFTARPAEAEVLLRGRRSVVAGIVQDSVRLVLSIDSIPRELPATGLEVPLRVEGAPVGATAIVNPASIHIYPAEPPADSTASSTGTGSAAASATGDPPQ